MTPEPAVTPGPAGSGVVVSAAGPFASSSAGASLAGPGPDPAGSRQVRRIFTTRRGGASTGRYESFNLGGAVGDDPAAVAANRVRLAAAAGLPAERVVWMRQVHGTTVTPVTFAVGGAAGGTRAPAAAMVPDPLPDTDGIVTATTGVGLAVLVADCVPVLAADPVAGVIAAVHAGRRGAAEGIVLRMLEQMVALGATAANIEVLLGPAICGTCYEVPLSLHREVAAALPGSASTTDRGTPGLDLRAGVARQLREAGVAGVAVDPRCTYTDTELFSHRRGSPTGRLAGLIWMPS